MSNVKKDFDVWSKDISASTVLHSLPDAVFITDPQMRIFYFNLAAENLTGFKSREALGMYCKDILKSGICETECAVKRALDADKNIFNIETTIVTATGQTLPILISALLIKDATGNIFGYLYSFRDISVLKKVMSDLEISRAELTERNIELARTLEELARDITERKQAEAVMKLRYDLMEYAGTHSLEEFLQKTLDEIGALTNSPIGFYHFVEPDQKTLSLQAWSTRTEKEFCTAKGKGMHYRIDQAGVWVDCVHERRPVIHNDYISLPHRKGLPEGHAAVIRELVVPIMREDHIVAILGIGNKPMDYTEKDAELVSFIADVAWEITKRKQAEEMLEKKSEEQTLLLDNIQTLIWYLKDAETQGIVNKACADFFGKKKEDLENKNLSDFMSKKEAEICIAGNKEVFEKKVTIHTEEWTKNAKGEKRLIAITKTPKIGENGNVEYVVCSAEDITERKRVEEALRDSEGRYRLLFNGITDAVYVHEVSVEKPGKFFAVNDSACRMLGYTRDEFMQMEVKDIDIAEQSEKIFSVHEKLFRDGYALFEGCHVAKDGRRIPVEINIQLFELQGKLMVLAVARDITERKQAEEAFRKSEEKFRTVADWTYDWEYWMSPEAALLYVSPSVERITGYSAEKLQRDPDTCSRIVYPEDQFLWNEHETVHFDKAASKVSELDFRILTRDGLIKWIHHVCRPVFSEDGRFLGRRVSNRDITKRKQAEEMLEKKSEEQTLLLDNIQTLIWYLKDAETQGIVNKACADFFGKKKEDLENKNLSDFMSKKEAEICIAGNKEVFEKKVTIHTEEWTKNAKGEKRLIAITKTPKIGENGNVEYVVCSAEDITEHKQADEALLRAEQLKVAGDLAVGLTHELKNSLTGIKISIEVLLDELVLSKDDRKVLMNMINETRRIELLIKDLLNFARPSKPQFAFVNINDVLDTALKLSLKKVSTLKNHGRSIDMVKEFDYHIPRTMADQMKLQQVFMNLLLNAVEAMQSSGSLKVQTSYNASNDLVHISISDTGKGIDHKLIDKIFDPFFTTKPKGTGLGLPISKRLIEQHGGNIRVETSLGKGTTFNIFLPVKQF
jgi:PAS domain S-box-containing protein